MHNDLLLPSSLWANTTVIAPGMMRRIDQAASESLNGDAGGSFSPSSPIILGGSGLAASVAALAAGGMATGPRAKAGGAVLYDPGSYPTFITGSRARSLVMPIRNVWKRNDELSAFSTTLQWSDENAPGTFATATVPTVSTNYYLPAVPGTTFIVMMVPPRFIHPSGILSLTLRFRIGARPAAVPLNMPGFRIASANQNGQRTGSGYLVPAWAAGTYALGALVAPNYGSLNGRQFRVTTAGTTAGTQPAGFTAGPPAVGTTIADGSVVWTTETGPTATTDHYFTLPRPSTIAGYYLNGTPQDLEMTLNQASFMATPQANIFGIDIFDLSGTNNVFHSVKFNYSAIANMAPPF